MLGTSVTLSLHYLPTCLALKTSWPCPLSALNPPWISTAWPTKLHPTLDCKFFCSQGERTGLVTYNLFPNQFLWLGWWSSNSCGMASFDMGVTYLIYNELISVYLKFFSLDEEWGSWTENCHVKGHSIYIYLSFIHLGTLDLYIPFSAYYYVNNWI